MVNSPSLITERLLLRQFTVHDAEALYAIFSDKEVNTFLPMFPLKTLEEAKTYLDEHYLKSYERPAGYQYAICLKSDNVPIGYIGVNDDDSHDLGYGLKKEFWGQGIMTEACRAVIRELESAGFPYITATHDVKNPGSGEVMKKVGMCYQYSYEEQWQPKDILVTFRLYQRNFDGNSDRVYRKYWDESSVHFVEKIDAAPPASVTKKLSVNRQEYRVIKLLGKGKGGYSYLVTDGTKNYVLKQIHHEPCSYYQFGDKLVAELRDYQKLHDLGIRLPKLLDTDQKQERILKEFIDGDTIYELVRQDQMKPIYFEQIMDMCRLLYPAKINIDYFPTNFVVSNGELFYIDYECNDYMDEWNFENWGINYWSRTEKFLEYEKEQPNP